MSGAQNWSVRGIDPKIREAAREAAARQGMSLGEYLNQALAQAAPAGREQPKEQSREQPREQRTAMHSPAHAPRPRPSRLSAHTYEEDEDDWGVQASAPPRGLDNSRLSQRIEAIERRTQLAVAGLDRAVSTIDRSVLGLSSRIDEAEILAADTAERITDALDQFRAASDTITARVESSELEHAKGRDELAASREQLNQARARLEAQAAAAEDVARKAEKAAQLLSDELDKRTADVGRRFETFNQRAREEMAQGLTQARDAALAVARDAADNSAAAVQELRQLHAQLSQRLQQAEARMADGQGQEQMARLQADIDARLASAGELRAEQAALVARIEKAEAAARESTAGLRQAAGAAIADLRNSQLNLAARLRQMEDGGAGGAHLAAATELKVQQGDIARRLAALESARTQNPVDDAIKAFERRLEDIAARVGDTSKFEKKLQDIAEKVGESAASKKLDEVDGAVRTLDRSLGQLSARIAETETSGNSAIRALEATVSSLAARVDAADANEETEKLRAMLEQRLDTMAQSVSQTVGEARAELAGQIQAVLGGADGEGLEGALEDVNRRLAAAERRQAQTIEAISVEIKRMSETVDRRLRAVEAKAEDSEPSGAVREELQRMGQTLEARFEEIERREAAAFDRMGLEIGRLSERLEERVGAVEGRSAQAIEQVGEQVARMAERFNQRHEILSRELGERMLDSEERAGARVSDAINSIMQRLGEVEEHSREAVGPVQKVISDVAARLENLENRSEPFADSAPTRGVASFDAATAFASDPYNAKPYMSEPAADPYVTPMQAAQPTRAGPLAQAPIPPAAAISTTQFPAPDSDIEAVDEEGDIYFADDDDFLADPPATSAEDEAARAKTEELTFEQDSDDDLLDDGAFLEIEDSFSATQEDDEEEGFWNPDSATRDEQTLRNATPEEIVFEPLELEPQAEEPAKKDYLTAARMAAQAQSVTGKRGAKSGADAYAAPPAYSLRGSSRVVLWGATSALALLIAGGAWYLNQGRNAPEPSPAAAAPDIEPATDLPPAADSFDPDAAFGPPVEEDGGASGGVEGAPEEPASAQSPSAELQSGTRLASAVAGPLAPRTLTLDQAARNGDSVAQYELALQRLSSGDREEAVALLRRAADRGLAMAQYRLAKLYERGEGVPADLTMARQWTERAAGSGNRRAMHDLGVYYARGEGAPLDESAAFRWFRQAAELGVADSQYNLGVLYQQGRGVSANAGEAMFWFLVAARQGDDDAGARATALEPQLSPMQAEQARARAGAFRPRAASAPANGQFGPRPWSGDAPRPSGA